MLSLPGSCRTQESPPGSAGHGCFPSPDGHGAEVDGNPQRGAGCLLGQDFIPAHVLPAALLTQGQESEREGM